MIHDIDGFTVRGVDVDGDPFEMLKPVPSLYSCHIEYEYLGKFGDCVDLNTLEDWTDKLVFPGEPSESPTGSLEHSAQKRWL